MNATTVPAHQNGAAFQLDTRRTFGEFTLGDRVWLTDRGLRVPGVIRSFDDDGGAVQAVVSTSTNPPRFLRVAPCELTPTDPHDD